MGLQQLARRLAGELDPARTLQLVVEALVEASGAERGLAMRWDGRRFVGSAADRFSETVLKKMRETRAPVRLADAPVELSRSRSLQDQRVRSVLAVPLVAGEELVGAVYLDHSDPNRFSDAVVADVAAMADVTAVALDRARRVEELQAARKQLGARPGFDQIIGQSAAVQALHRTLERLVDIDYPVLIEGESGTGKELVARALHYGGRRAQGPFIPTNCGGMAENILATELFGAARGAYTGADRDRPGLFEAADGGTLFLDEIEAMSSAMQEALLRALESGEIRRVGETAPRRVDVRVIAATNVELESSEFRKDLFYRIAVLRVPLAPLRARMEDLPLLADHLLARIAAELKRPEPKLNASALKRLSAHSWPGNVRELQNALKRAVALTDAAELTVKDFDFLVAPTASSGALMSIDEYIRHAHASWSGQLADDEIAARLGISRKTLWAKRQP